MIIERKILRFIHFLNSPRITKSERLETWAEAIKRSFDSWESNKTQQEVALAESKLSQHDIEVLQDYYSRP